jgi:hypothetical protein
LPPTAEEKVVLWADAICINQEDLQEKCEQVQQMKLIYQRAQLVVVWLGPAAGRSDTLMDTMSKLGEKALQAGILQQRNETRVK